MDKVYIHTEEETIIDKGYSIVELDGKKYRVKTTNSQGTSVLPKLTGINKGSKSTKTSKIVSEVLYIPISTQESVFQEKVFDPVYPSKKLKEFVEELVDFTVDQDNETIELTGTVESIQMAKSKMINLAARHAKKLSYTHFISFPIQTNSVRLSIEKIQQDIIEMGIPDIDARNNSFIKKEKLHFTLGMLALPNSAYVEKAASIVSELKTVLYRELNNAPLQVDIKGLAIMGPKDSKVGSVLYAKVKNNENGIRMLHVCELIRAEFYKAGLLLESDKNKRLLLHATVINTRYNRNNSSNDNAKTLLNAENNGVGGGRNSNTSRTNFSQVLDTYKDVDIGSCILKELQIAKRFKFNEDGSYFSEGTLQLP
ncbi:Activating signal cointegrator 1 complex subunit 1 [Zancudomyces culisetae]|uniref:Activating signal cointegrator 1 complex subunit 1 n=1 Tax=Zancudomyces culisetae TaxID=1213189 RepID=A0A1R1PIV5_ZANCU|nr:Activating signal cointegrator 1 complex subunit 1 [Zancudomyces culisetae]|eukprot:OMH80887.1 Activating signal cointegrator 1 complex subunit 1 [Zancudomyces culisetae]